MPGRAPLALTAALAAAALAAFISPSASAAGARPSADPEYSLPPLPPGLSGFYGGGAIRDYLDFVSLRVRPGGALRADATLVTHCGPRFGDLLTENIAVRDVRLDGDGRYSARSRFTDRVEPGVSMTGGLYARGTILFSARVAAGGIARGTARVKTTYSKREGGPAVSRCDTGRIGWAARRPAPDAGAGRSRLQPGTHRGATGQRQPFLMRVSNRGRLVKRAGLIVHVDCRGAIGVPLDVVAQQVRVRRGGFAAAGGFERSSTDPTGRRVVERYRWALHGRFGGRGARGTLQMNGVVRRTSDGRRVDSCGTGRILWRASR